MALVGWKEGGGVVNSGFTPAPDVGPDGENWGWKYDSTRVQIVFIADKS